MRFLNDQVAWRSSLVRILIVAAGAWVSVVPCALSESAPAVADDPAPTIEFVARPSCGETTLTLAHGQWWTCAGGSVYGGYDIAVRGAGFRPGATVTVGDEAVLVRTVATNSIVVGIAAVSTPHPGGPVDVVVTNADGQSVRATGGFTFGYAPTVSDAQPRSLPSGVASAITVTGTNLVAGATWVTFGIQRVTPTRDLESDATNVDVIPGGTSLIALTRELPPARLHLTVSTWFGSARGPDLIVDPPPATISSIYPTSGSVAGGTLLTISGQHFTSGAAVRIGGVAATSVAVQDATRLTAIAPPLPPGPAHDVVVTWPGRTAATRQGAYTTLDPAAISGRDDDGDAMPDEWELLFGLDPRDTSDATADPDGDGVGNAIEHASGTHPRSIASRFLAEGATIGEFTTTIALLNPSGAREVVNLRFVDAYGSVVTHAFALPAMTRATVIPGTLPGLEAAEFATTVESDGEIVVDRTITWPGEGHAERSLAAPSLSWYFAEGATHSGLDLFYLLYNPNEAEAEVRVRYLRAEGAPIEKAYALSPRSRTTIWVNQESFAGLGPALESADVSAVVEVLNAQPIIAERAMYLGLPGSPFSAGHESAGVTAPATQWFLAEGATGPFFDMFLLVANTTAADAQIDVTYALPSGARVIKPYIVAASTRATIWVDHEDPVLADTAVATTVRSANGVPVIVERAMWWPGTGWSSAHNSPGETAGAISWALAEGEVDATRGLETYILVANTSDVVANVRVTLVFEDGTIAERMYEGIAAGARFNVSVGDDFPNAASKRFGAIVESVGGLGSIVVERAMYWDAGRHWAGGTVALATKRR